MLSEKRKYEVKVYLYWKALERLAGQGNYLRMSELHNVLSGQCFDEDEIRRFLSMYVTREEIAFYFKDKGYNAEAISKGMGIPKSTIYNFFRRPKECSLNINPNLVEEMSFPNIEIGGL